MKQKQYKRVPSCEQSLIFNSIPDEILVHILAQPMIDLLTLGSVMNISERFFQLAMRVLSHYRLPAIEMALSIDQEGKSRVTNRFEYSHFCNMTLNAVFVNPQPTPKRYYTNKAYPSVRLISMEDYYTCQEDDPVQLPSPSSSSFIPVLTDDDGNKKVSLPKKRSHSADSISGIPQHVNMTSRSNTKTQNHKLQAQKEGLHILQVIPLQKRLFPLPNMGSSASWKMAYQISNKENRAYFLTPINFCIPLEQLIRFEQRENNKTSLGKNTMINWFYGLK